MPTRPYELKAEYAGIAHNTRKERSCRKNVWSQQIDLRNAKTGKMKTYDQETVEINRGEENSTDAGDV